MFAPGAGFVINGIARTAGSGGSLNGSFGFQLNYSPFPAGTVGVMKFDGAGNVAVSLTSVGGGNSTPRPQPSPGLIPSIPMGAARSISVRRPVNLQVRRLRL